MRQRRAPLVRQARDVPKLHGHDLPAWQSHQVRVRGTHHVLRAHPIISDIGLITVQLSSEMATTPVPLGTLLEDLVGLQCYISPYRLGRYQRCQRISELVIVTTCPKCGQGGMLPTCGPCGALITKNHKLSPDSSLCPDCNSVMKQSEPVKYPPSKPVMEDPVTPGFDEDWSDLYESGNS